MPPYPIPVTILTGFLGSGKTTLLNRLLQSPVFTKAMVFVNEFGEISLDHLLVEGVNDTIIKLSNGCLCCSIQGDLLDRLNELVERLEDGRLTKLSHLIIETTGIADPVPILQLFMVHPLLLQAFHLEGVVAVVDAIHGQTTLETYEEARRQVALADRLVVSKCDLLPNMARPDALITRLEQLNPVADIFITRAHQELDENLFQCKHHFLPFRQHHKQEEEHEHSHHHGHTKHHHDEKIKSLSLVTEKTLQIAQIETFFDHLRMDYGRQILRLKGIIKTFETPNKPLIVHGAQGLFHPPQWLDSWTGQDQKTKIVMIADSIDWTAIKELFATITSEIGIGRADLQALADNPLAIPGLKF